MKTILEKTETDITDSVLIKDTLSGDKSAFGELVLRYQKKIYRLAHRIIGNSTDSADIVQETFIHAYQNLKYLRNYEKFSQWLCQIAKNQCIDWIRSRQNSIITIENEINNDNLYLPPTPDEILIERELFDQVMKAIENLPENNRKVAKMFYLDGKSYLEIQAELGITKGTLGRLLYEARVELSKLAKHFSAFFASQFNDFISDTGIIAKCFIVSIALHLIAFGHLSVDNVRYCKINDGGSKNSQYSNEEFIIAEYLPIMQGMTDFGKRNVISIEKAIIKNEKKFIPLDMHFFHLSKIRNPASITKSQHIGIEYDISLIDGNLPKSENSYIKPISLAKMMKPNQLIYSESMPILNELQIPKTDETQEPSFNSKSDNKARSNNYVLANSWRLQVLPTKIASDKEGNIYISDVNCVIRKYSPDGQILLEWGRKGTGNGEFNYPSGIAIDKFGNMYISDKSESPSIQKFDTEGKFLKKWGTRKSSKAKNSRSPESLGLLTDLAVDDMGNIFAADATNNCIHKFNSEGKWIKSWGEWGNNDGQLKIPTGIAVDSLGTYMSQIVGITASRNLALTAYL